MDFDLLYFNSALYRSSIFIMGNESVSIYLQTVMQMCVFTVFVHIHIRAYRLCVLTSTIVPFDFCSVDSARKRNLLNYSCRDKFLLSHTIIIIIIFLCVQQWKNIVCLNFSTRIHNCWSVFSGTIEIHYQMTSFRLQHLLECGSSV